jgi:hypothetical protein
MGYTAKTNPGVLLACLATTALLIGGMGWMASELRDGEHLGQAGAATNPAEESPLALSGGSAGASSQREPGPDRGFSSVFEEQEERMEEVEDTPVDIPQFDLEAERIDVDHAFSGAVIVESRQEPVEKDDFGKSRVRRVLRPGGDGPLVLLDTTLIYHIDQGWTIASQHAYYAGRISVPFRNSKEVQAALAWANAHDADLIRGSAAHTRAIIDFPWGSLDAVGEAIAAFRQRTGIVGARPVPYQG